MKLIDKIIKANLKDVEPYSYVRNINDKQINLDLNEAQYRPYGCDKQYNFYPETQPSKLINRFAQLYQVEPDQVMITRGGDESIQLIVDTFATPYASSVVICSPTFDSYRLSSILDGAKVIDIPLQTDTYQPNWAKLKLSKANIYFFCSPANPIGNLIPIADLQKFAKLKLNSAVVVVDEAYLEFANAQSATTLLKQLPNVIVLKTLSKAYALAGIRMGITIADKKIIQCLLKSLAPYPLASPCVDIVDTSLSANGMLYYQSKIANLIKQRTWLIKEFKKIKMIKKVFPSQTNFILLIVDDPSGAVNQLTKYNIIIKNKNKDVQGAIRISVGTDEQNKILIAALKNEPIENNIRTANLSRITKETEIYVETTLDGKGTGKINTGLGFFDHMLDQIKKHSQISLTVLARGDLEVDVHHLIEDTGILFGQCLKKALGNKVGIERYAANTLVMDEAKAEIAIDICDRPYFCFNGTLPKDRVGMFPSDLVKHFFDAIAKNLGATLNISVTGENTHHMIEIIFKCFAKVLKSAIAITSNQLMSTKGVI